MMDARRRNNLGFFSQEPALTMPDRIAMIDLTQGSPRQVTYGEISRSKTSQNIPARDSIRWQTKIGSFRRLLG